MAIVCEHKKTMNINANMATFDTDIEVCLDCGASRSMWEQGQSEWQIIPLLANALEMKKAAEEIIKQLEGVVVEGG